jgi:trimeric autotransporter adhesin
VFNPTSLAFGTIARRTRSTLPINLSNPGTAVLTINSISIGGANGGQFSVSRGTCGSTLAVGATCTMNVTFSPNGRGNFTATLSVSDNAAGSPQTAALSGTGQ